MSTDWGKLLVTAESARELYDFIDVRPDLRDIRAAIMNTLVGCLAARTYAAGKGMGLIVYEDVAPDDVLISGSTGELLEFKELEERAVEIDRRTGRLGLRAPDDDWGVER